MLQKVYKDNDITLKECSEDRIDQIQELNEENSFLSQYLPTPLTDEELLALIGSQMSEGKRMLDIMKYLSTNYESRYDSKKAILIINSLL